MKQILHQLAVKITAFYQKKKRWLIAFAMLAVLAAIAVLFWPQSRESRIRNAIVGYHEKRGQKVDVQPISFRTVSDKMPDSLRLKESLSKGNGFYDLAMLWLRAGNAANSRAFEDSMSVYYNQADMHRLALKTSGDGRLNFTKCDYIARIATPTEKFTDTLTVILNDSLHVVWPGK